MTKWAEIGKKYMDLSHEDKENFLRDIGNNPAIAYQWKESDIEELLRQDPSRETRMCRALGMETDDDRVANATIRSADAAVQSAQEAKRSSDAAIRSAVATEDAAISARKSADSARHSVIIAALALLASLAALVVAILAFIAGSKN